MFIYLFMHLWISHVFIRKMIWKVFVKNRSQKLIYFWNRVFIQFGDDYDEENLNKYRKVFFALTYESMHKIKYCFIEAASCELPDQLKAKNNFYLISNVLKL